MWAVAYVVLIGALVLRVRTDGSQPPDPALPLPGEPLWLTRAHHALLTLALLAPLLERLLVPATPEGRVAGLALLAGGVVLYRVAGRALGDALSPFIEPRAGAPLVTRGPYRHLRHPIYLSEAMIALGAPLTLGCRLALVFTAGALAVLALRIVREEDALARTFPEYPRYAAATKRFLPFVY